MRIGLLSDASAVPFEALEPVCRAIRAQLRELAATWGIDATVEARHDASDGDFSYVKISVDPALLPPELMGQHRVLLGEVSAQVRYTASWSVTASHECIELATNPNLDATIAGPPPSAYAALPGVDRDETVDYLRELCDPCQSGAFAYAAPNSDPPVMVSDFVLPEYYEPASRARTFSFNGAVTQPFQILRDGYLSWGVPRTRSLWQQWTDENGVPSQPERIGDWRPRNRVPGEVVGAGAGRPRAHPEDPKDSWDPRALRELLYRRGKDYKLRRIPDEKKIADVVAAFRRAVAPGDSGAA